jgi:hypothetical protein
MSLQVKERGKAVATFRYIQVEMMEMLAQWTPSAPEMEVKLMLGEHIWDMAQNADALGKRTRELRLPLQHSIKPADSYIDLLAGIRRESDTCRRLGSFYDVLLPAIEKRFQAYLKETDSLLDAPTVRIMEQISSTTARMIKRSRELRSELPELGKVDRTWLESLAKQESQISSVVA